MEPHRITVREYAYLSTPIDPDHTSTLDHAQISPSAFDWLCELQAKFNATGVRLVELADRRSLRLDSFVGTISTPCGTHIEILPKHYTTNEEKEKNRQLMCRLIASALNLPWREAGVADLNLFRYPLSEWVIRQFLTVLSQLVKRGLRYDYQQVEDEQPFLRGQLNVTRQLRQPPGKNHRFHQRHALFLPDRPENRLLRLALNKVSSATQEEGNWRLAHELLDWMKEVPASRHAPSDFARWGNDRLMAHYRLIKPWCELVLGEHLPLAIKGRASGISLLFPMERLFEQHVAKVLQRQLVTGAQLITQATEHYLCRYNQEKLFLLKPDMLLKQGEKCWVLDTKWKRLEQSRGNYGIAQSDAYQMSAYGTRYLEPNQALLLVYPQYRDFTAAIGPLIMPTEKHLYALPFDLDTDVLLFPSELNLPFDLPSFANVSA